MDTNSTRQDAIHIGGELEKVGDKGVRALWHMLKKLFKMLYSFIKEGVTNFYLSHRDGFKAIQNDGDTKKVENISGLSYEEMEYVLTQADKEGVPVTAYEWQVEKGKEGEEEFKKGTSIAKQKRIIKHTAKIEDIKQFKAKHPKLYQIRHKHYEKSNEKHTKKREDIIEERKGNKYRVAFNVSRSAWVADIIVKIKEQRTGVMNDIAQENEKSKVAVDFIKERGFDMNVEEIREFSKDFVKSGTMDISYYDSNYFVHIVDKKEYERISSVLEENNIIYGVGKNEGVVVEEHIDEEASKATKEDVVIENENNEETYSIYIDSRDAKEYVEKCGITKGSLDVHGDSSSKSSFVSETTKQREVVIPTTAIGQYLEKLQGTDYKISVLNEEETVLSIDSEQLNEVYEFEKKNNTVEDKYEHIRQEKSKDNPDIPQSEKYDTLLPKAAQEIFKDNSVSRLSLQRKFKIGVARSEELMKQLIEYGVIKESNETNTYEVAMTQEEFAEKYKQDSIIENDTNKEDSKNIFEEFLENLSSMVNKSDSSDEKELELGDDE